MISSGQKFILFDDHTLIADKTFDKIVSMRTIAQLGGERGTLRSKRSRKRWLKREERLKKK